MNKKALVNRFKWTIFLVALLILCILAFITFLAAFGRDEGTLANEFFPNLFADFFIIFRFPMHNIFWDYMNGNLFFVGLFINCALYALIIERLTYVIGVFRDSSFQKAKS